MTRAFCVTLAALVALIWAGSTGCRPRTPTTEASPAVATAAKAGAAFPPGKGADHVVEGTIRRGRMDRQAALRRRDRSLARPAVVRRACGNCQPGDSLRGSGRAQPAESQCDALGALGDLQHSGIRDATAGGNSPGCGTSGGARRAARAQFLGSRQRGLPRSAASAGQRRSPLLLPDLRSGCRCWISNRPKRRRQRC